MSVKFLDHVELGGSRVRFLGDPVDPQDAATRAWVLDEISEAVTEAGALDTEGVQDVVGAMLDGTGITVTYNDTAGTIDLTVTDSPTVGGFTPANLRDRTTHTGTQSLDTTTDSATRVAFTPAERTKLSGVATGATANATNAELRDRATHTGTQALSTITGHDKAAHDALNIDAATLDGETGADFRDRDTHTGTQSLDTTTDSATRLAMTAAERTKLGGVATGATANSTDAFLLARGNHTGTQSADTIVDGTTNHVFTAADDTKLAGIATGATANATDADLRDRTTHTGTQSITTITGHNKAVHDALLIDAATVGGLSAAALQAAVTSSIVDGAPGTLDTLNEIAAALQDNPDVIEDLLAAVALRNITYAEEIGDGVLTTFTVTHNIGSEDVTVQVWEATGDREQVNTSVKLSGANAVIVSFANAPAADAYRVVVQGRPTPA